MAEMQMGKLANGQRAVAGSFRTQLHWQKAQAFAADVVQLVARLPRDAATNAIGSQLIRSAGSIGANIAEGYGRFSQAAYRNHLSIARGSAFESESWLDLLTRCGYLAEGPGRDLTDRCIEVEKLVSHRMKELPQGKSFAVREEMGTYEA